MRILTLATPPQERRLDILRSRPGKTQPIACRARSRLNAVMHPRTQPHDRRQVAARGLLVTLLALLIIACCALAGGAASEMAEAFRR